jgi:DNA-binding transcriptional MerR regulator
MKELEAKGLNQQIYTNKEASQYLRLSVTTLRRERQKGNITFRRSTPTSKVFYTKEDLNNYLERNSRNA